MDYDDFDMDDYGDEPKYYSELQFNGVKIRIDFDIKESKEHIYEDYKVIQREGLDKIVLEKFIPWLKGKDFADKDDKKILEGLKLHEITYTHHIICEQYSPTKKEDYFGKFAFGYESGSEYTEEILTASVMEVYILNGEIVKVSGYDV